MEDITVPEPLLNVTILLAGIRSKPLPFIIKVGELFVKLAVLGITMGAGLTLCSRETKARDA